MTLKLYGRTFTVFADTEKELENFWLLVEGEKRKGNIVVYDTIGHATPEERAKGWGFLVGSEVVKAWGEKDLRTLILVEPDGTRVWVSPMKGKMMVQPMGLVI